MKKNNGTIAVPLYVQAHYNAIPILIDYCKSQKMKGDKEAIKTLSEWDRCRMVETEKLTEREQ